MANIGVILAGGFAKGAYQIGVLKALREYFSLNEFGCVSASSIGSLNAFGIVHDKLDIAREMWSKPDFKSFRTFTKNYLSGKYISNIIDDLIMDTVQLRSSLYITCFNYSTLKLDYINLKNVDAADTRDYLRAGVAMPMFVRAVRVGGYRYADGGMIDNIPVKPMEKYAVDYAVVVHFDNDNIVFENEEFDKKLIKINFIDDRFIKNSISFDKKSITYMLQAGYDASRLLFKEFFARGTDDLPFIFNKIKEMNAKNGQKKTRITGDVIMGNINKLMKKLISCNDPEVAGIE